MARNVVALLMVALFVIGSISSSGIVSAEDPPPWVVTGVENYQNTFLFLENDIVVENGGLLD